MSSQAEYQLYAANAQIGAARAALLPTISLTGLAGLASSALSSLFTGGAFSYSLAPNVSYPIFRAGAGKAGVRYSQAAARRVSRHLREGDPDLVPGDQRRAVTRGHRLTDQLRANRQGVAAAQDTLNLVNAQYRGGISHLPVESRRPADAVCRAADVGGGAAHGRHQPGHAVPGAWRRLDARCYPKRRAPAGPAAAGWTWSRGPDAPGRLAWLPGEGRRDHRRP